MPASRVLSLRCYVKVEEPTGEINKKRKRCCVAVACFTRTTKNVNRVATEHLIPWTKKEPSSRFAARRTLFHVWYHARSGAISARQGLIRDCPRLLPCADRAWLSKISHVEQRSSGRESRGWFFFFFVQDSTFATLHPILFIFVFVTLPKTLPSGASPVCKFLKYTNLWLKGLCIFVYTKPWIIFQSAHLWCNATDACLVDSILVVANEGHDSANFNQIQHDIGHIFDNRIGSKPFMLHISLI